MTPEERRAAGRAFTRQVVVRFMVEKEGYRSEPILREYHSIVFGPYQDRRVVACKWCVADMIATAIRPVATPRERRDAPTTPSTRGGDSGDDPPDLEPPSERGAAS